jgi:hypothetical protein
MKKKLLLSLAIVLTACNLTIGIGYAAVCQSTGGARACGTSCAVMPDGGCLCQGTCTADELAWVAGAKGDAEERGDEERDDEEQLDGQGR